jgi:catechol 2,3-dioxygenase-like lactoylglutathione lyase family enzyme
MSPHKPNYLNVGRAREMKIEIESINHVCLVVKNLEAAKRFYCDTLGFSVHHKVSSWLILNQKSTLHLVNIPEAEVDNSLYHEIQHFALQVPSLRGVLRELLAAGAPVFQMDFEGQERAVSTVEDPLDFGLGTIFTRDPDGNLVEFLQLSHGIFKGEYVVNESSKQ